MNFLSSISQGAGSLIGGLASGIFGYKGTKDQNIASAAQAQKQMDFQREMSNTAIQRRMADLKKAGLNPILAAKHEASSPSGAMAVQHNKARVALENAFSAAQINKLNAETALTRQKITKGKPLEDIADTLSDVTQGVNNASKSLWEKFINYGKENPGQPWIQYLMDKGLFNIAKDKDLWDEWISTMDDKWQEIMSANPAK